MNAPGAKEIPIKLLRPDPACLHREIKREQLQVIRDSERAVGLLHPIIVRQRLGDRRYYYVMSGMLRLEAAIKAGYTEISCVVLPKVDDEMALEISLRENLDRTVDDDYDQRARAALDDLHANQIRMKALQQDVDAMLGGRASPAVRERVKLWNGAQKSKPFDVMAELHSLYGDKLAKGTLRAIRSRHLSMALVENLATLSHAEQARRLEAVAEAEPTLASVAEDERIGLFASLANDLWRVGNHSLHRFLDAMDPDAPTILEDADHRDVLRVVLFCKRLQELRRLLPEKYRQMTLPPESRALPHRLETSEHASPQRKGLVFPTAPSYDVSKKRGRKPATTQKPFDDPDFPEAPEDA